MFFYLRFIYCFTCTIGYYPISMIKEYEKELKNLQQIAGDKKKGLGFKRFVTDTRLFNKFIQHSAKEYALENSLYIIVLNYNNFKII